MDKVVVIGASSGIGMELAKSFANSNYLVGITGRRKALLHAVQATQPQRILIRSFDCTLENAIVELENLVHAMGGMDLLIYASGTGDLNQVLDQEIVARTNALNVTAFARIVNWGFQYMKQQNSGHLVAISSIGGLRGSGIAPSYNASKAYQINYLEGLRQKVQREKLPIAISDVRPGFVATAMAKGDGQFWVASPEKAARQIFQGIRNKRQVIYVTKRWRIIAVLLKFLPTWIYQRM